MTAAEPGERFECRVRAIGLRTPRLLRPIATWEYRFEQVSGGTRATETWTDDRRGWPGAVADAFDRIVTRGDNFAEFQRRNIHAAPAHEQGGSTARRLRSAEPGEPCPAPRRSSKSGESGNRIRRSRYDHSGEC